MKYLYILFLVTSITNLYSQDIILKKNGETIDSKIIEIGIDKIKYHKYSNLSGPVFVILKEDVTNITFENGDIEMISASNKSNIDEIKKIIIDDINEFGFERDTYKSNCNAFFEGDILWLQYFNKKGKQIGYDNLYDLSIVYKFAGVSKREDDLAYINIWTSLLYTVRKKEIWNNFFTIIWIVWILIAAIVTYGTIKGNL